MGSPWRVMYPRVAAFGTHYVLTSEADQSTGPGLLATLNPLMPIYRFSRRTQVPLTELDSTTDLLKIGYSVDEGVPVNFFFHPPAAEPMISGNGDRIVYWKRTFPTSTYIRYKLMLYEVSTQTERVLAYSNGPQTSSRWYFDGYDLPMLQISADGSTVVFASKALLVRGFPSGNGYEVRTNSNQIYALNINTNELKLITAKIQMSLPVPYVSQQLSGEIHRLSVSADGKNVVYAADSSGVDLSSGPSYPSRCANGRKIPK